MISAKWLSTLPFWQVNYYYQFSQEYFFLTAIAVPVHCLGGGSTQLLNVYQSIACSPMHESILFGAPSCIVKDMALPVFIVTMMCPLQLCVVLYN